MLISFLSCLGPQRPQPLAFLYLCISQGHPHLGVSSPAAPLPGKLPPGPLNHPPIIQVSAPTSLPLKGRFPIYCGGSSHSPVTLYSTTQFNVAHETSAVLFVPTTMPDSSYKRFKTFLIHKCSTKKYLCSHLLKYVPRSLNPIISSFPKSKISSMVKEAVTVS